MGASLAGQPTVKRVFIDQQANEVVVRGRVTCTQAEPATVRATLTQGSAETSGTTDVACTTKGTAYEVRMPQSTPPIQAGTAMLAIGAAAGDSVGGREEQVKVRP
jgi:hypothetical protein